MIRQLWDGGYQTFRGEFYDVEQARLYTLPEEPPPIAVAAKPLAAGLAGRAGDALISTAPEGSLVEAYRETGGDGPRYAQITVCWAESEDDAKQTAHRVWRTLYFHQVGRDQEGFFRFWREQLGPRLER